MKHLPGLFKLRRSLRGIVMHEKQPPDLTGSRGLRCLPRLAVRGVMNKRLRIAGEVR